MADIRKFGGCIVLGLQSISQLQFIYGRIRASLKAEGAIQNPLQTQPLVSKHFDSVDLLRNYEPDDVVRFDKTFSIAKKGDDMKVTEVDKAKNMLALTNLSDGTQYTINPAKLALKANISVYEAVKIGGLVIVSV